MAAIPANIIFPWSGNNGSIPSGWTRETTLDDYFPKGWGTKNPGMSGGSDSHTHVGDTHTHTMDAHGHSVSLQDATQVQDAQAGGSGYDNSACRTHGHNAATISTITGGNASDAITYPADSATNNRPPYHEVIYIKAGVGALLPTNAIALWNSTSIPLNYLLCTDGGNGAPALGNKYLKGATHNSDSGGTGGSLTHTHALNHSHSTTHSHSGQSATANCTRWINTQGGSNQSRDHTHTITLNNQSVTTDTYTATLTSGTVEPLYKKLLAILKQANGVAVRGIIGLWLGDLSNIPKNWLLCNGQTWSDGVTQTPDLQNYFVKIANDVSELGNTGGSNTHLHAASNAHTHSGASHTHSASVATYVPNMGGCCNGDYGTAKDHGHVANTPSSTAVTWSSASMSAQTTNNEPSYIAVAFVQLTQEQIYGGMF